MNKPVIMTREVRVGISIQGYHRTVCIGKDVIRLLGTPSHVSLRINENGSRIVIEPCAADDVMSFKVPEKLFSDHRCVFRITSKQFVHSIMELNGMDMMLSYTIPGMYSEKQNVACFDLSQHCLHESRRNNSKSAEE